MINLSGINTVINDRRRDVSANSIDMTTVGFRAINSTLEIWNEVHDWPWTIKQINFNYNQGISTYALDSIVSDFKFPLTVKYYKPTNLIAEFTMVSPLRFDSAYLWSRRFAIQVVAGVQTLRIKSVDGNSASINTATAYNENGTWIGSSAVSGLYTDNYEGFSFPASVAFVFNGTSGTITNDGNLYTTFTPVDLTAYQNRSNIYMDVDFSSVTNLTSITLEWGTDSSDYYTATVTTDYLGNEFAIGWIKLKFPWSSIPSTVGNPTITIIKYLKITITCGTSTNLGLVRMQNIFVSENVPLTLTYYSTSMVQDSADSNQWQVFQNSADTTDFPLWSGRWDMATEPFINSVLEIIFWMTGETTDMQIAKDRIAQIVQPLKERYPSQRRYSTAQIVPDINFPAEGNGYRNQYWPNSYDPGY